MLSPLSLTAVEESIYRDMVAARSSSSAETAARLNIPIAEAELALSKLQGRGLVNETDERLVYSAVAPSISLRSALIAQDKALREFESEMNQLDLIHRSAYTEMSSPDTYMTSQTEIASTRIQLLQSARETVKIAVKASTNRWSEQQITAHLDATKRGVRSQILIEADALEDADVYTAAERLSAAGCETQLVGRVPAEILAVDHAAILLPVSNHDDATEPEQCLLVRNEVWIRSLDQAFDVLAELSYPFRHEASFTDVLSSLEQRVLALQLGGLTDRAIGTQLNLSERSVQRYVSRMMERSGAKSRIQLGWYAREHNWIDA